MALAGQDALKPWRHRSWIFPRDPDFAAKAAVVLELYTRRFQGRRLEPGEFVVSADEKTSIQARCHWPEQADDGDGELVERCCDGLLIARRRRPLWTR